MAEQGSASLRQELFQITKGVYDEYATVARAYDIPIEVPLHTRELCGELSILARMRIEECGIPTDLRLFSNRTDSHYFLHVPNGPVPDVVCLTWQQFLSPESRRPELPRALIWPRATIVYRLGELGMPRSKLRMWRHTKTSDTEWQRFDDRVLEKILG